MTTKGYTYDVSVTPRQGRDGRPVPEAAPLCFEHFNHDDILAIAERMRRNSGLTPDEAAATAVGVKLLSEVMLRGRSNALFDPLREGMRDFIRGLKSLPSADAQT